MNVKFLSYETCFWTLDIDKEYKILTIVPNLRYKVKGYITYHRGSYKSIIPEVNLNNKYEFNSFNQAIQNALNVKSFDEKITNILSE